MKNRQLVLRDKGHEIELPGSREPGEPIRRIGFIEIDRSVFKKTSKEKEILKLAKLNSKRS